MFPVDHTGSRFSHAFLKPSGEDGSIFGKHDMNKLYLLASEIDKAFTLKTHLVYSTLK